jgi:hypothetical protein
MMPQMVVMARLVEPSRARAEPVRADPTPHQETCHKLVSTCTSLYKLVQTCTSGKANKLTSNLEFTTSVFAILWSQVDKYDK